MVVTLDDAVKNYVDNGTDYWEVGYAGMYYQDPELYGTI